uniref:Reverse transcriptase domain-containing protein n=1 Tax=Leptobrachium leishanense TaxID=445787 RepID=A0A8C5QK15_9ANUR
MPKRRNTVTFNPNFFYRWGGRSGKPLACMANPRRKRQPMTHISTGVGTPVSSPDHINSLFYDFFRARSQTLQDAVDLGNAFLEAHPAPRLQTYQRELLECPILEREVGDAITCLKSGKSPGPDGLTADYYKILKTEICPVLTTMFNDINISRNPIDSFNAARTILIPKPVNPLTTCLPIAQSLFLTPIINFSKILTSRLQTFLPDLLTHHQLGFVHGQHSVVGIRQAVVAVLGACSVPRGSHLALLSLDLEQAFDSVSWSHLLRILHHRCFGHVFTDFIHNITRYGQDSPYFLLGRGVRQGCPLSPLLFDIALDPLLRTIKHSLAFRGISVEEVQLKVSAFADDLLLFTENLPVALPSLFRLLYQFQMSRGYGNIGLNPRLLPS